MRSSTKIVYSVLSQCTVSPWSKTLIRYRHSIWIYFVDSAIGKEDLSWNWLNSVLSSGCENRSIRSHDKIVPIFFWQISVSYKKTRKHNLLADNLTINLPGIHSLRQLSCNRIITLQRSPGNLNFGDSTTGKELIQRTQYRINVHFSSFEDFPGGFEISCQILSEPFNFVLIEKYWSS